MSKLVWQRNRDGAADDEKPKGPSQLQQQLESTDKSSGTFFENYTPHVPYYVQE